MGNKHLPQRRASKQFICAWLITRHFSVLDHIVISTYTDGDSPTSSLTTSNLNAHPSFFSQHCRWFKQGEVDLFSWELKKKNNLVHLLPKPALCQHYRETTLSLGVCKKKDPTYENTKIMQHLPPPSWQASPRSPRLPPQFKTSQASWLNLAEG